MWFKGIQCIITMNVKLTGFFFEQVVIILYKLILFQNTSLQMFYENKPDNKYGRCMSNYILKEELYEGKI